MALENYIGKSKYFEYLYPLNNEEVIERVNDFIWFEEPGLLCSVPKEEQRQLSMAENQAELDNWIKEHGDAKLYMISVINPHTKSDKEGRDWAAEIMPKFVNAVAIINNSALGRMAINLFIGLRPPTYALKVFKDSKAAREWTIECFNNG